MFAITNSVSGRAYGEVQAKTKSKRLDNIKKEKEEFLKILDSSP